MALWHRIIVAVGVLGGLLSAAPSVFADEEDDPPQAADIQDVGPAVDEAEDDAMTAWAGLALILGLTALGLFFLCEGFVR